MRWLPILLATPAWAQEPRPPHGPEYWGGVIFVLIAGLIVARAVLRRRSRTPRPCPNCGKPTLMTKATPLRRATKTQTGLTRVTTSCASCGWTETRERVSDERSGANGGDPPG